jgi:ribonuclease HII
MSALVCGVDEAGRGPLAGPVVAAAVILGEAKIDGIDDSKKIAPARREVLAKQIREQSLAFALGVADVGEIEKINILEAAMTAMQRAVSGVVIVPDEVLVDGNRCPQLPYPARAIIGGDGKIAAIAAASILAKTARDALMNALHREYPQYGFDEHKGYPTPRHIAALKKHGPCPHHRRTFAPVAQALGGGYNKDK